MRKSSNFTFYIPRTTWAFNALPSPQEMNSRLNQRVSHERSVCETLLESEQLLWWVLFSYSKHAHPSPFCFFKKRELFVVVVVEMLQTFPSLHSEKEDSLSCSNTFLCSPDIQPGPVSYTGVQTATVRVSIYILFCCCQLFVVFLICRFYLTFGIAGQEMCLLIRLQITWYFLKTV